MEIVQEENQCLQRSLQKEEQRNQGKKQEIRQLKQLSHEKDHVIEDRERQLQKLNQQLANRKREISKLQRERDQQIQYLQQQLQVTFGQIQDKDAKIVLEQQRTQQITRKKDNIIQAKDKQLQASEQVNAEFKQKLQQKKKEVHELQEDNKQLQQKLQGKEQQKLTLTWKTRTACRMLRGSAAVCGSIAYFGPDGSNQVHSYNSDTKKWSTLPECPTYYFTLTVVNGLVTTVGGSQGALRVIEQLTNTLSLWKMVEGGSGKSVYHICKPNENLLLSRAVERPWW